MILRPIRSIVPRPELRSGWAERTKMTTISASGGAHGSRRLAKVGAVIGHDTSVLNHEFHAASRRLDAPDARRRPRRTAVRLRPSSNVSHAQPLGKLKRNSRFRTLDSRPRAR